jgi:hypothetical protein
MLVLTIRSERRLILLSHCSDFDGGDTDDAAVAAADFE